ncbi:ABC transporter permease [Shimazuella kribbensis]|uniref:ABC transporter permease n=1 Tax=Shimazuella kribbensis TaxID=139808 RepID=UPI0004219155|nr:ABC transporter permease [Shimazuella kribbensis]
MNIVSIAIKEMKTSFRNPTTLFFALGLPVILILALGTIFLDSFKSTITIGDMKVLYMEQPNTPFSKEFQMFMNEASNSKVFFEKAENPEDSKKKVEQNSYDGYVELNKHGIYFYQNDNKTIGGNVIQGMLNTFVDQSNLANSAKVDQLVLMTMDMKDDYIKETTIYSNKQPRAIDYFSVSMTTMMILFGTANAIHLISEERKRNTADRLIVAPITKLEIFLGKIFGSVFINTFYFLVVIVISKYIFNANWGANLGVVIFVLITEVFLATSLGVIIGSITKSAKVANSVIQVVAIVTTIFSGTFYKMEDISGVFYLNPLNWVNEAILDLIYANDFSTATLAIVLNIVVSLLFLLVTITLLHRREGL